MATLKEQFNTTMLPALKKEIGYENPMSAPRILKVTINTGLSAKRDAKFIEVLQETLKRITGQTPVVTKARKSIAGFKVRENMPVGAMVTLRGDRMWDFLTKLVNVSFPRIRDFRGIEEAAVDKYGNFNYGFREHIAFPEISGDEIENLHGLQVTITTSASNREEGLALFKALGFPFKKKES